MRIQHKNKKILILILATTLVAAGGLVAYWYMNNRSATNNTEEGFINYGPPTEEEANAGDERKKQIVANNEGDTEAPTHDSSTSTTKKTEVQVGIVGADQQNDTNVEVRAFIQGVIEGDGKCTAIFSNGTHRVTASSRAFVDASTSQCRPIVADRSMFPVEGTWSLVVTYESNGFTGKSEEIKVSIR